MMNNQRWQNDINRDSKRLKEAEKNRRSILVHTVFLGTISVLFLAPLLAGAYLGHWLDSQGSGYTVHWTINLILLGLCIGIFNVVFFFRKYW